MKTRNILSTLVLLLILNATLQAQVPRTEGKTLSQKSLVVADTIKGKTALLIVTFSKKAGDAALPWTKALQAKGIGSKCVVYQVAQLENVPGFFRRMAVAGMRKGVPAEKHDTFVILAGDTKAWKDFVGFEKEEDPHLVLMDTAGAVRHKVSGEVTDERLQELSEKLK